MSLFLVGLFIALYIVTVLIMGSIFSKDIGYYNDEFAEYIEREFGDMKFKRNIVKYAIWVVKYTPILNSALLIISFIYAFIKVIILDQHD